jgi:hypothetical protein
LLGTAVLWLWRFANTGLLAAAVWILWRYSVQLDTTNGALLDLVDYLSVIAERVR